MNSSLLTSRIERCYLMLVLIPPVLVIGLLGVGIAKEVRAYNVIRSAVGDLAPDQRPSLTAIASGQPDAIADKITQAPQARLRLAAEELTSRLGAFSSNESASTERFVEAGSSWPDYKIHKKISDAAKPIIEQILRIEAGESTVDFQHATFGLVENKLRVAVFENDHASAMESLEQLSKLATQRDHRWSYPTRYFDKYNDSIRQSLEIDFWQTTDQLQKLRNQIENVPKVAEQWEQRQEAQRTMVRALRELGKRTDADWVDNRDRNPFGIPYEAQLYNLHLADDVRSNHSVGTLGYARDFNEQFRLSGGLSSMTLVGIPHANLRGYQTSWIYNRHGSIVNQMAMRDYQRKITQVLLAVKQFQLQEEHWPKDLQELSRVGLGPNDIKVSKNLPIRYERSTDTEGVIVWRYLSLAELFRETRPQRQTNAREPKRDSMMIKHLVK